MLNVACLWAVLSICSVSLFYNLNGGPGSLMWSRNIIFFNQLMETFSVSFLASIYDVWYFSIFFFSFFFFKRTKGDKTALITQWISYFGRILFLRTTFFLPTKTYCLQFQSLYSCVCRYQSVPLDTQLRFVRVRLVKSSFWMVLLLTHP